VAGRRAPTRPSCSAARSRCGCAPGSARATSSPRSTPRTSRSCFGTLLSAADAARVAAKVGAAIAAPILVGGSERSVPVALGIAHYPQDGNQAERLLRRALALAAVAPALNHAGPARMQDAAGELRVAANDEA
jgi:GGDEF domain-containing protein